MKHYSLRRRGSSFGIHQTWSFCQSSSDVTPGLRRPWWHSAQIIVTTLAHCSSPQAERPVNLAMSAAHWGRKWGGMCPTPPRLHPGGPQVGGGEGGEADAPVSSPTFPAPGPSDPGEGPEQCRRGGGGDSAAAGEGGSEWGGGVRERRLRPPLPPEGKGRRWPARCEPDAAASAGGRSARDRVAPSGSERARRQRGHVRGPSSCALPPPRAALSIHKFSACSAATGHRSPPGTPRSRPPPMGRAPRR